MGFYRALVEFFVDLAERPRVLEVEPYYFSSATGYRPGRVWS
jgi:hypothetical protein